RPGVVGLYLRIAMSVLLQPLADGREDVDRAGLEGDDRALGVLALADPESRTAVLARAVERVHARDLDAEDLLDREPDLRLVRARVDDERVLAVVDESVGLLAHDGRENDVARVLVVAVHSPASSVLVEPAWVFDATKES